MYPFVAFLAGYIFEQGTKSFRAGCDRQRILAEILLFAGGLGWLYVFTHSLAKAAYLGLYWFVAGRSDQSDAGRRSRKLLAARKRSEAASAAEAEVLRRYR